MSHLCTWSALKLLGFKEDPNVMSDDPGGLSYCFKGCKLSASVCVNRHFREIILFTGVYDGKRVLTEVCFEMPREVESYEQAAAWLSWSLEKQLDIDLESTSSLSWLEIGRLNYGLLPWERERMKDELRPQCFVDRDWMRIVLKRLRLYLSIVTPMENVYFGFDGTMLKIEISRERIEVPGTGKAWPFRVFVTARDLEFLPKRLLKPTTYVSCGECGLILENRRFPARKEEKNPNQI